VIMLAIFLAPVSGGIKINENKNLAVEVEVNEARAQTKCDEIGKPCVVMEEVQINRNSAKFNVKIINIKGEFTTGSYGLIIKLTGNTTESETITTETIYFIITEETEETETQTLCIGQTGCDNNDSTLLTENTSYTLIAGPLPLQSIQSKITFTTAVKDSGKNGSAGNLRVYQTTEEDFGCDIMPPGVNIGGCVLQVFFILWQATALVARLAGHFLDFFIYYATDSASYTNTFVSKAWAAVRDIANVFFIIALLFIAIKTILNLNVTNNKKLIGAVIIVALVINFSLFTTKVVIDGSNILAKIFYNNITSTKAGSTDAAIGAGGEKSISVGLVDKFNPQNIVMDAYNANLGLGYAIFLTLLLMAVTLYTAYIFFSVALLFVARVVSLWISMIFSPIAFASYTVPFEIPGFGHKEWWKNLLENAFLAPLFVFFLYIIVMFTEFLGEITKYQSDPSLSDFTGIMRRLLTMIIPFIIIVMLLTKAKNMAVKFSGDMGKAVMTGAKLVGGLALGAATGGTALALRATAGRGLAAAANSGWAKKWEAKGYGGGMARSVLKAGGKGSFDLRGIKIAGKDLASTGLKVNALPGRLGKTQEGGWEKTRKDKVEKRQKRAEELKVGEDEKITQKINRAEMDLQVILNKVAADFQRIDKGLEDERQKKNDSVRGSNDYNDAVNAIARLKAEKKGIKDGTAQNAPKVIGGENNGKTIHDLENSSTGIITTLKNQKQTESRTRTTNFANTIQGNKFTRIFAGRGGKANREAQHKIIMESKLDSGTKT